MSNTTTIVQELATTEIGPATTLSVTIESPPTLSVAIGGQQGVAGVGLSPGIVTASEALEAGDFVHLHSGGVELADASVSSKPAHGFVLTNTALGVSVTVHFGGINTGLTGLTKGPYWLDPENPGKATATPLTSGPGVVQQVGIASSATALHFLPGLPVVLAGTPD